MRRFIALICCFALLACEQSSQSASAATPSDTSYRSSPGYIVDSAITIDEELRRFREGLGEPVVDLEQGYASREELAKAFLSAAASRDSAALQRIHINRREFAYLYFPTSKFARPPYELAPGLVWLQLTSESDRGITKLMQRLTNNEPVLERVECAEKARIEGQNKFWENCTVSWRDKNGTHSGHLFGEIVERDGMMKLLSFANDL